MGLSELEARMVGLEVCLAVVGVAGAIGFGDEGAFELAFDAGPPRCWGARGLARWHGEGRRRGYGIVR